MVLLERLETVPKETEVPPPKLKTKRRRIVIKPKHKKLINSPKSSQSPSIHQSQDTSCSPSDLDEEETPLKFLKLDHRKSKRSKDALTCR